MQNPWRFRAVEFAQTAAQERATTYRERAAQLTAMAASEPIGSLRGDLADLARQYAELAASLENSRSSD